MGQKTRGATSKRTIDEAALIVLYKSKLRLWLFI